MVNFLLSLKMFHLVCGLIIGVLWVPTATWAEDDSRVPNEQQIQTELMKEKVSNILNTEEEDRLIDLENRVKKLQSYIERIERKENKEPEFTGFSSHKANYLLPLAWPAHAENIEDAEVKFQISVKQQIGDYPAYIAFTQKSLWEMYDGQNSRPFRETNYNPEFFLRSNQFIASGMIARLDLGIEHESNGAKEPFSRSWNRVYLIPQWSLGPISIDYKIWHRLSEPKKKFPEDPEGDENPDIYRFYSHSELKVELNVGQYVIAGQGRWNSKTKKGGGLLDMSGPTSLRGLSWYLQYWEGYGESLIDYNRYIQRLGWGLMITR